MSPEFTSCQVKTAGHWPAIHLAGRDSVECKPSERSHLSTHQCLPSYVIPQIIVQLITVITNKL